MQLIKNAELIGIDDLVQRKHDLAYVKGNQLLLQNSRPIELPYECFVVGEPSADYTTYIHGEGFAYTHRLNEGLTLDLVNPKKSRSVIVLSTNEYFLNYSEDAENTITYFKNGQQVWQKPQQKRYLGNNATTIVTSPNFKMTQLEVRDLATFTVQQVIDTDKNYKVSHHTNVIDDTLIFFQHRSVQGSPHLEVIATAINLTVGSILWTTTYQGSHWFLFNDSDKRLYCYSGVWENKLKSMYLEIIDPLTGEHTKEHIVNESKVSSIPWLTKIINNILYIADSDAPGTCIHALDLNTKKFIARCDLHLAAGVKITEPYIAGDDLWVLDTEKTLHQLTISG